MKTLSPMELQGLRLGILPRGVSPGNLIPVAAMTARHTTTEELESPTLLQGLYQARTNLEETLRSSFGVETQLRQRLLKRLPHVEHEITRLETAPLFGNLPTMDPSFLSWQTQEGYPAFSVYTLDNPLCRISFSRKGGEMILAMEPGLSKIMEDCYLSSSLKENLLAECAGNEWVSMQLMAKYAGSMPQWVRDRIHEFVDPESVFPRFEFICIVAEAPEWEKSFVREIPVGDPLVIGVYRGLLHLIAAYDLSPVEQVAHDLCQGAKLKSLN